MLEILNEINRNLIKIINDSEWKSLNVTYHAPRIERVYAPYGDYRVCLHVIHPCKPSEALFHPHPWPSAVRVVSGAYEMGVGYGDPNDSVPPEVGLIIAANKETQYEMTDPSMWHYVSPICRVLTVMVNGKPWKEVKSKSKPNLKSLPPNRQSEILNTFKNLKI